MSNKTKDIDYIFVIIDDNIPFEINIKWWNGC